MSSKKGELEVPPSFLKAFGEAKKVREIIRKTFAREELAGDQLDDLKQIIRDAGYVYTETERASDVPGIEVHVGMHGMGNVAHEVGAGTTMGEKGKYEVMPNAFLSLEFRPGGRMERKKDLDKRGMRHIRGAPHYPQTQGKIDRSRL